MTADAETSVWNYAIEVSRALSGHGIRVSLSTSGSGLTKEQRREAARVSGLAVYESGLKLDWNSGPPHDVAKARSWLGQLEERLKPDIVQLNGFSYGPLQLKVPTVNFVHSEGTAVNRDTLFSHHRIETAAGLDCSDIVIFPSRAMLDDYKAIYSFNTPARVIPYFRSLSDIRSLPKQKFVFSAGHRSDPGIASLAIESAANELNWSVVASQAPGALQRAGAKGANRMSEQLSKASIYCQPAIEGPSETGVLEGALSRCALIVPNAPSLRENWNNCALFCTTDRPETFKESVQLFIRNQDLREEYAERAYARAREFSPERCVDEYLDAYHAAWTRKFKPLSHS